MGKEMLKKKDLDKNIPLGWMDLFFSFALEDKCSKLSMLGLFG